MTKLFTTIPDGKCECPKCNGTGIMPLSPSQLELNWYKSQGQTTTKCNNCGGQFMYGEPTGLVNANRDGEACLHNYVGHKAGRCLTEYVCTKCSSSYQIDSGD